MLECQRIKHKYFCDVFMINQSIASSLNLKNPLKNHSSAPSSSMKNVASVILGGGEGKRLHPLTLTRCKPDINFGGRYRLIDIPISNSYYANCYRIFVLTQFLSSSLHQHISHTYMQTGKMSHQIEILAADQKPSNKTWYQGTADAVRQNIEYLLEHPIEYFLILSGDQLYNIDFTQMMKFAEETDADVTIAALPVTAKEAGRLGILKIDAQNMITNFHEKPQEKELLEHLKSPLNLLQKMSHKSSSKKEFLGSMGIYLFKRKALVDLLREDIREDFGKHLIPTKVTKGKVAAFVYEGYWEDIGTIGSFFEANMALTHQDPLFNFHNEKRPLFSNRYDLPPTRFSQTQLKQALFCEGCLIEADEITQSILGPRSVIGKGCVLRDTYLMGNDYYTTFKNDYHDFPLRPSIGENSVIKRAIIDRNVAIGKNVQLLNKKKLMHYDGNNIFIRDGVIVVPRGANIPDGFIL